MSNGFSWHCRFLIYNLIIKRNAFLQEKGEEQMEKIIVIDERTYQEFKRKIEKKNDYWNLGEIEKMIQYANNINQNIDFFIN